MLDAQARRAQPAREPAVSQGRPPTAGCFRRRGRRTKRCSRRSCRNDGVARGLDALVTELQRVAQFGFTATELARAKQAMMLGYERVVTESPDRESASRADEYTRNFLQGEALPTIWQELAFHRRFVPDITLAEVNALAARLVPRSEPAGRRLGAGSGRRRPARSGAARRGRQDRIGEAARAVRGCGRGRGAHGRAAGTRHDRQDDVRGRKPESPSGRCRTAQPSCSSRRR